MPIQVQSSDIELVLQNTIEYIEIAIYDDKSRPIDPVALKLSIMDTGNNVISIDTLYPRAGEVVDPLPARIKRIGRGVYYFPFGEDNANGTPATFYRNPGSSPPWDISVNNQLKFAVDSKPFITLTLTAAIPTQAQPSEIVAQINAALVADANYGSVYSKTARFTGDPLFLTSPRVIDTSLSRVQVDNTIAFSAVNTIFGVTPAVVMDINGDMGSDGVVALLLSNKTMVAGDNLFLWQVTAARGLGSTSVLQVVKIASPRAFSILPYFRLELDKALKQVGQDLARTGYTDAQLMGYLMLAVTEINAFQPITNLTLDSFPIRDFMMILIWTALIIALISQGLFAIDTDINYSDRGASFNMEHSGKISGYVNMISSRLQSMLQGFKLQYAGVGTVKIELGPSFRLASILNASPSGTLFRGLFSGGV